MLLIVLTPVNDGRFVGGLLQYDWLCAMAAGFAFLRRGRPFLAGSLVAYAVATRIFPAVFLAAAALPVLRGFILDGRVARRDLRFFGAAGVTTLAIVATSVAVYGTASWQAFGSNISHHNEAHRFGERRIGLDHEFTRDVRKLDFDLSDDARRAFFAAQEPLRVAAGTVLSAMWLGALWRRKVPDAFLLGVVPFFVLTVSSRYYWSCLALLPLLATAGPMGRWRPRLVTAFQLAALVAVSLYSLRAPNEFALYSVFNLVLIVFFVALLVHFLVPDLAVFRRRWPLAS